VGWEGGSRGRERRYPLLGSAKELRVGDEKGREGRGLVANILITRGIPGSWAYGGSTL
jgi:hypothetical protein